MDNSDSLIPTVGNPTPSGSVIPAGRESTAVTATKSRALAETQAAVVIAAQRPRDETMAIRKLIAACGRVGLARSAQYTYQRGGQEVSGASVQLLQTIAQYWGNIQFGFRELDRSDGESEVEAFAWDVETNTRRAVVFRVPHAMPVRGGVKRLTDPRDVYEWIANQAQRRVRSCLEAVIPPDVVEMALEACNKTLHEKDSVTPDGIKRLVASFEQFGVTESQIAKRVGRKVESITPQQLVELRKIWSSIKDGMSEPADWFEVDSGGKRSAEPQDASEGF